MLNISVWPLLYSLEAALCAEVPHIQTEKACRQGWGEQAWGWNIAMQPPVIQKKGPWDRAVVTRDFRKMPLWSKTTSEHLLGVAIASPIDLVKMQILKNLT